MSDAREPMSRRGPASGRRSEQASTVSDARESGNTGLQPERTRLSWSRTALSLGAVGGLVIHTGGTLASFAAGLALILLGLVTYIIGVARYRRLSRAVLETTRVADPRALTFVGVCVALATPATLLGLFA